MSRVHDALKRAEQERGAMFRARGIEQAEPAQATPATGPIPVISPADAGASYSEPDQSSSDPLAVSALLSRCPQTNWDPDTKSMLFFSTEEPIEGTEEFRTLRSRLYQLRESQPLRKILIASSLPQEGKSFTAANLAQVMAIQHGCRTLLIDGDLRNPALHVALGASPHPGLSDYLLGEVEELAIIQRGQMENLFFIPAGRAVSGQAELISNGGVQHLLDRMAPVFEWIFVDSPSALPVSDSGLLSNLCDGVLMIVRSGETPFDLVRKALQRFSQQRVLGVVLNGVPDEMSPNLR